MNDILLQNYAKSVQKMRSLQSAYFSASGKAKKGGGSWDASRELLKQSKAEELKVDKLTNEILNHGETEN